MVVRQIEPLNFDEYVKFSKFTQILRTVNDTLLPSGYREMGRKIISEALKEKPKCIAAYDIITRIVNE